tara:strand:+ start:324 stop:446 length:123 start_codon:yes stop_codon:yes gene_type:complete
MVFADIWVKRAFLPALVLGFKNSLDKFSKQLYASSGLSGS